MTLPIVIHYRNKLDNGYYSIILEGGITELRAKVRAKERAKESNLLLVKNADKRSMREMANFLVGSQCKVLFVGTVKSGNKAVKKIPYKEGITAYYKRKQERNNGI